MTREEFDKLYLDKAVHCDTEEKANHFLALADSVGYKWFSGNILTGRNYWEANEEKTCYEVIKNSILFGDTKYFKLDGYQIIEYTLPHEFKVGDKVRIKNTFYFNGKVGVIEKVISLSPLLYSVKAADELWYFCENDLEKIEEPTHKEENVDDIIEEIKEHQKSINVLLKRLEGKAKVK